MGAVAAELADRIVLTSEDPRVESAKSIAKDILRGIPKRLRKNVRVELDRTKAISLAVNQLAKRGDWVVSCGKGHEESMNYDGVTETPWSDYEAIQSALERRS